MVSRKNSTPPRVNLRWERIMLVTGTEYYRNDGCGDIASGKYS